MAPSTDFLSAAIPAVFLSVSSLLLLGQFIRDRRKAAIQLPLDGDHPDLTNKSTLDSSISQPSTTLWRWLRFAFAFANFVLYWIQLIVFLRHNVTDDEGDSDTEEDPYALFEITCGTIVWLYASSLSLSDALRDTRFTHQVDAHLNWLYTLSFAVGAARYVSPSLEISSFSVIEVFVEFALILVWVTEPRLYVPVDPKHPDPNPSPEQTASFLSLATYAWIDKLIIFGWFNTINNDDVYTLPDYDLASYWAHKFEIVKKNSSLLYNLLRALGYHFTEMLVYSMLWSLAVYIAPYSLKKVLDYIQDPSSVTLSPYIFVFGLFAGPLIETTVYQRTLWINTKIVIHLRAIITSELFVKLLRIPESGSADPDDEEAKSRVGKLNNMIQTDIGVFEDQVELMIYLLTTPLRFLICIYFLYSLVGWSCFLGLTTVIVTMPIPAWISSQFGIIQERVMQATDKRLGLINELLQSIRMIKFFAWEDSMKKRVTEAREDEITQIRARNVSYIYMILVWSLIPLIVMFVTLFAYTKFMGRELTASVAFTVLSLFNIVRELLGMLPWGIASIMRAKVSYERIAKFLGEAELQPQPLGAAESITVGFQHATFQWFKPLSIDPEEPKATSTTTNPDPTLLGVSTPVRGNSGTSTPVRSFMLRDLDVTFPQGELSLVAGKTASGKTSMFMALLGEMHRVEGNMSLPRMQGIAYCAQTAWLQNDTIKNNILFGAKYHEQRYKDALFQCALLPDLAVLDAGDETEIGEKGITLSGGQKQRIALARAVYSDAQTVLLDDCLSAVDSHTAKHLIDHCLLGSLLRGRTRVLITHYVSLCASSASYMVVMDHGRIIGKGAPSEVLHRNETTRKLLLQDEQSDLNGTPKNVDSTVAKPTASGSGDVESIDSEETKVTKSGKLITTEERSEGSVGWQVYQLYMDAFGGVPFWTVFFVARFFGHLASFGEYFWIQVWTQAYQASHGLLLASGFTAFADRYFAIPSHHIDPSPDSYLTESFSAFTMNGTHNEPIDVLFYLGVYGAIGLSSIAIYLITFVLLIFASARASRNLHRRLLDRVCAAPIRWFDKVPMGRIVNRFAKDMAAIDSEVYETISRVIDNALDVLGILIIISFVMPIFILPGIGITIIFIFIGRAYVSTNLALRRLVSVNRSPIYSLFGDSVIGLVTIRAFSANQRFYHRILQLTDQLNRPEIFMWSVNRWLHFRNTFFSGFIVLITGALIVSGGAVNPGLAGTILTLAMQFTEAMLWLVRNYNMNELNMNSVERVSEYLQIEQEPVYTEHGKAPAAWPTEGDIKVESLSVQYSIDTPLVLKDLSFEIRPREKIGVVGRTGSGKSTLALTLLRFVEVTEGRILINGIDISQVNLSDLRSRVTIIPQDPLLLSGTIRFNLDPFGEHDDAVLWAALRHSHLIEGESRIEPGPATVEVVNDDNESGDENDENRNERVKITLDSPVSEGGHNFSQGERQLIALARALVRRSKVLILDEATSSVDADTDEKIQTTIRTEFNNATLLTIAHRLRTVVDYNKILVLSEGQLAEFDTPYNLLEDHKSIFHAMCKKSGEYHELYKIAKESQEQQLSE